ncbi:carboxypeptidase-like regulatory domain-containing protein [Zhouia sp. PK063]|uniref:carboxypeptidase-like regulatory domain-containing protein n=1 Tax=Zhouia sp. PK063 TaxID=3373602 RepID=UPI00378CDE11
MKRHLSALFIMLTYSFSFAQISGTVVDKKTGNPLQYVNVWIKNTRKGSTTNNYGEFKIEFGKIGDTILISNLGYQEKELLANSINQIALEPKEIELEEVVIIPFKNINTEFIKSYPKKGKVTELYYNGYYSLARYYPYKATYSKYPFIKNISVVTSNALKSEVTFRIQLIKADENGKPTKTLMSEYKILKTKKGKNETFVDLIDERIQVPKNGFFVVVDRLNLDENKFSNKIAKNILQPAIGMESKNMEPNTWMYFGGRWIEPKELKNFVGTAKNIAVNVELTD